MRTDSAPDPAGRTAAPADVRGGPWLVIVNPSSGRGRAHAAERAIRDGARAASQRIEVRRTGDGTDPRRWARAAADEGFRAVVAVGGDGTVAAAANGLLDAGAQLPLGIVPTGTGNGLARVLRMPFDPGRAFRALLDGSVVQIDVIDVRCASDAGERAEVALLFVGAGLDADLNRDADARSKSRFGFLAYVMAALRNLTRLHRHRVCLTVDGVQHDVAAHTVSVFNGGRMVLAGVPIGPDADPHDGHLDVAVLRATGFWRSLAGVVRLATRDGSRQAFAPARGVRVEARPTLRVHVDGDVIGTTPLRATVRPAALRVIAASPYAAEAAAAAAVPNVGA
ncbi:MAG: diacylglycerol kinase family protein [Trueperaceae bacterium]